MFTWAGFFGSLSREEAYTLRNDFLFRVGSATTRDKARPLCLEVLGYDCDRVFMRRWGALQELVRLRTTTRARQESAPVTSALAPLSDVLPSVFTVLGELGWWLEFGQQALVRRDLLGGLRRFCFGSDGLRVLHEWHRREAIQACGRLGRGFHRPSAGWASGSYLPLVAPGARALLRGIALFMPTGTCT